MDAGERVRLGVELLVAQEFEDRGVVLVAARLGDDVHLRALVPELRRVDAGLDLELLDRVDRGQGDVVLEVRVGVIDAVERVVVEEDALATGGDGLLRALAAKSGAGLPGRGREHVDVGRLGDQIQVLPAVQRQFGHHLVLDDGAESNVNLFVTFQLSSTNAWKTLRTNFSSAMASATLVLNGWPSRNSAKA